MFIAPRAVNAAPIPVIISLIPTFSLIQPNISPNALLTLLATLDITSPISENRCLMPSTPPIRPSNIPTIQSANPPRPLLSPPKKSPASAPSLRAVKKSPIAAVIVRSTLPIPKATFAIGPITAPIALPTKETKDNTPLNVDLSRLRTSSLTLNCSLNSLNFCVKL